MELWSQDVAGPLLWKDMSMSYMSASLCTGTSSFWSNAFKFGMHAPSVHPPTDRAEESLRRWTTMIMRVSETV